MKLHYQLNIIQNVQEFLPIILIHGLFGDLSNFNAISKFFNKQGYTTLQIDLRNHGKSPHNLFMNYEIMALDILNLLDYLSIKKCIVIGYSMGGKVAMTIPKLTTDRIDKMIIIDIAPVSYDTSHHDYIFSAIQAVTKSNITERNKAFEIMVPFIKDTYTILFLLKSFQHGKWCFNIDNIYKNYSNIKNWEPYTPWSKSILFIQAEYSSYICSSYYHKIYYQFPQAQIKIVHDADHRIYITKYNVVLDIIINFLNNS